MYILIRKALQRPISTLIFYVAVVFFAFISLMNMRQEFIPPIDLPSLLVLSSYPAASQVNTRSLLTKPLENALSGVQGLKAIKSLSRNGLSLIELQFEWATDMLMAGIQVREVIDAKYPSLPQQVAKPIVLKIDPNQKPVMILGFYPKKARLEKLRQFIERELRSALQQTPGVGTTIIKGGRKQEVKIEIQPLRLGALGLDIDQLGQLLQQANFEYPAGNFREGTLEYLLKNSARAKNLEELGELPLTVSTDNEYIRLKDLSGAIYLGNAKQVSYFSNGKEEGIALIIRRQGAANIIQLSARLQEKIIELEGKYNTIFRSEVLYDAAQEIRDSLDNLIRNLLLGIFMAFIVVVLLIGSWRVALILIFSIPLSLLMTILLMYLSGLTLNTISLAALTLSVGLLVDNSVVVLEQLEKRNCRLLSNTIAVIQQNASPILSATLTSVFIFLPLLFLPNIIGAVYRDLSLTLSYALLSSFLVSVTVAPLVYHLFHSKTYKSYHFYLSQDIYTHIEKLYKKLLKSVFYHYKIYILVAFGIILSTIPVIYKLPKKAINGSPGREVIVEIKSDPNTSIDRVKELSNAVYQQIKNIRLSLEQYAGTKLSYIYVESGGEPSDSFYYANPQNTKEKALIHLVFKDNIQAKEVATAISSSIRLREAEIQAYPPGNPLMDLLGIKEQTMYLLSSSKDDPELRKKVVQAMPENLVYEIFPHGEQQEIEASPRREYLEQNNLSASQLQTILQNLLEGKIVSEIELEGELYPIRLEIPGLESKNSYAQIQSLYDLESMVIPVRSKDPSTTEVRQLRLGQLANLQLYQRSAALQRVNQKDSVTVALENQTWEVPLNLESRSLSDSVFAENAKEILWILLISLLLLYFFLGIQFSSFWEPLPLLLNIPFSLWGSSMLLWLTGKDLTMNSLMGILILFGLCVNNAIVLREEARKQVVQKTTKYIYVVWLSRFRAISVTTLSTVLALLPSALSPANAGQQNLALTIIGGMISSSFFTICILPLFSQSRKL